MADAIRVETAVGGDDTKTMSLESGALAGLAGVRCSPASATRGS
ncbi:MAG: hypothetical protein R2698_12965 [Microthrixaceae bacterium]